MPTRPQDRLLWGLVAWLVSVPAAAQYVVFDQATDTIDIPGETTIGSTLTIEARVRFCATLPSTNAASRLFNEQHDSGEDKILTAGSAGFGGYVFRAGHGPPFPFFQVDVPVAGHVWHHVAYVVNGTDERLYLDGVLASSRTQSGTIGNVAGSNMAVGALVEPVGMEFRPSFLGVLDTLRVSTVARYGGQKFTPPTGDLASDGSTALLYNFNDGVASTTAADSGPNGWTGSLGTGFGTATSPLITNAAGIAFCRPGGTFDYALAGPGGLSATGTHWISLPRDIASPVLDDCSDLAAHIPSLVSLSRFDPTTNSFVTCSCPGVNCFPIVPGQGYEVRVSALSSFQLAGTDGGGPTPLAATPQSLDGRHLVSLPFGTPLANAADLTASIGGVSPGPVLHVGRLVTSTDTVQLYTGGRSVNFDLTPGEGYQVRVSSSVTYTPPSFGGDYCDTDTSCFYLGRQHTALGAATLALDGAGRLAVNGLGTTGLDGVELEGPGAIPLTRAGKEDWTPLGMATTARVPATTTPQGAEVTLRSSAQLSPFARGFSDLDLSIAENAGGQIEITFDFTATGTTNVCYAVRNNGAPASPTFSCGHPQASAVVASDWPVRHGFAEIEWETDVSVTLPLGLPQSVDELLIRPDSPTQATVDNVNTVRLFGRCGLNAAACTGNPGLTSVSVIEEGFDQAAFDAPLPGNPSFVLSTSVGGTGSGFVTSTPTGINCGGDCTEVYAQGTGVTLTGTPAAGSYLSGFLGHADCTDGALTMSGARYCTAVFGRLFTLSVATSGNGSVTSSPPGISCGGDCSESYAEGSVVTLQATPAGGWNFSQFTGDADCADGTVTMSAARSCTAVFQLAPVFFTLSVARIGSGTVTSSPAGINCGADCSESYLQGTAVTLQAAGTSGWSFAGYSGDADCMDGSVTMTAARSCTATFVVIPAHVVPALSGWGFAGLLVTLLILMAIRVARRT